MTPSAMDVQLFLIGDLAIHLYSSKESISGGTSSVKTAHLYVPGLPQMTDKRFFQKIVDKDNAYFYAYYYGTWLSGGVFTPVTCRKTVTDALDAITKKAAIKSFDGKEFKWEYEQLAILGCSFAGNQILSSALDEETVSSVELYSPLVFVEKGERGAFMSPEQSAAFDAYNSQFLYFMRHGYPNALRGITDKSWDDYFAGNDPDSKLSIKPGYPPIKVFHGANDITVDPKSSGFLASAFPDLVRAEFVPEFGHDFITLYNHINKIA